MKAIYYIYAWVFGWPAFKRFNYLVYSLSLRAIGIYNYSDNKISGEKWLIDNVVKSLGNNLVIFDVGANRGSYTRSIFDAGVSVARIYAFEPHPSTFKELSINVAQQSQVRAVQAALSDQVDVLDLFDRVDGDGTSHASLSSDIFSEIHRVQSKATAVQVTTLDAFCDQHAISAIDLLKVDVEGYEINVLRGAEHLLRDRRIRVIQFEFTQLNAVVGVFFKELYDVLSSQYRIFRLLPHGLVEIKRYDPTICEIFGYQNFAAILKR